MHCRWLTLSPPVTPSFQMNVWRDEQGFLRHGSKSGKRPDHRLPRALMNTFGSEIAIILRKRRLIAIKKRKMM